MAIETGAQALASDVEPYLPQIIRKAADQIVSDSTDLVNDTHLLMPVGIDEVWAFKCVLKIVLRSATDMKYTFTVPANGAVDFMDTYFTDTSRGTAATKADWRAATETLLVLTTANITNGYVIIHGIYIGGDTAGNLQLQWAQNAAVAEDSKVLENSYIIAHQLA